MPCVTASRRNLRPMSFDRTWGASARDATPEIVWTHRIFSRDRRSGTGASRRQGGDPVNRRPGERARHGRQALGFRAKQESGSKESAVHGPKDGKIAEETRTNNAGYKPSVVQSIVPPEPGHLEVSLWESHASAISRSLFPTRFYLLHPWSRRSLVPDAIYLPRPWSRALRTLR
jgi:hypothetical protein